MITSFAHKGLEKFFFTGIKAAIHAAHTQRLSAQLRQLDKSSNFEDMNLPGWGLHPLHGELKGHFSVKVSGNWRMTFKFEGADAVLVNYQDYH